MQGWMPQTFKKFVQRLAIVAWVPAVMLAGHAGAATIYGNTTTDTGLTLAYAANGYTQIGDRIQLAGTERFATSATVQFYNNGSVGTFDATLRLFNVGAPVGFQIGPDFTVTGIGVGALDVVDVAFSLPLLEVPGDLIFTVAFANPSAGVDILGLNLFEPPTIGSSDNTFAIARNASGFIEAATVGENVFFELQAVPVPEPSSMVSVLFGLLVLFVLTRPQLRHSASGRAGPSASPLRAHETQP